MAAGLAMLEQHNGCYIADVVGMGKTFIGAEILRRLTITDREAGDPLIICPAASAPCGNAPATSLGSTMPTS